MFKNFPTSSLVSTISWVDWLPGDSASKSTGNSSLVTLTLGWSCPGCSWLPLLVAAVPYDRPPPYCETGMSSGLYIVGYECNPLFVFQFTFSVHFLCYSSPFQSTFCVQFTFSVHFLCFSSPFQSTFCVQFTFSVHLLCFSSIFQSTFCVQFTFSVHLLCFNSPFQSTFCVSIHLLSSLFCVQFTFSFHFVCPFHLFSSLFVSSSPFQSTSCVSIHFSVPFLCFSSPSKSFYRIIIPCLLLFYCFFCPLILLQSVSSDYLFKLLGYNPLSVHFFLLYSAFCFPLHFFSSLVYIL